HARRPKRRGAQTRGSTVEKLPAKMNPAGALAIGWAGYASSPRLDPRAKSPIPVEAERGRTEKKTLERVAAPANLAHARWDQPASFSRALIGRRAGAAAVGGAPVVGAGLRADAGGKHLLLSAAAGP